MARRVVVKLGSLYNSTLPNPEAKLATGSIHYLNNQVSTVSVVNVVMFPAYYLSNTTLSDSMVKLGVTVSTHCLNK